MRSKPLVSIVIPTRDNVPMLANTIGSLNATHSPEFLQQLELIISSNGSDEVRAKVQGFVAQLKQNVPYKVGFIHSTITGFGHAVNGGMSIATGDNILLLNDDVVLSDSSVQNLLVALETTKQEFPEIKWGYIGPRTNNGIDTQTIKKDAFPDSANPNGANVVTEQLQALTNEPTVTPLQFVSGFCFLMSRDVYEAVGDFDESLGEGGFEDNDYCLRAVDAGYLGLVCNKVFIFHYGQQTLNKYVEGGWNKARYAFLKKWYKPRQQSICAAYRVKIDNKQDYTIFCQSLNNVSYLVDSIVILDDKSSIDLKPLIGTVDKIKTYQKNPDEFEFDEIRDRDTLVKLAREQNPDWIMNLDHDEWPDITVTKEELQALCNPIDPQCKMYSIPMSHFWRGKTHIRADGVWGGLGYAALWKNSPAWGGIKPRGSNLHCRRAPEMLPLDALRRTYAFTIEHMGYSDFETQVLPKYKYYNEIDKTDPDKKATLIGSEGYEHFIDESHMTLLPYKRNKTDLLYLGKNERTDLLTRIHQYARTFNNLIVVDTGSTDDTKKVCETFGIEYHEFKCCDLYQEEGHLCDFAAARNKAIEYCKSDYIAFMDPDEEFDPRSIMMYDKALLEGNPDAIMCDINNLRYAQNGTDKSQIEAFKTHQPRIFKNRPEIRYNDPIHETLEKSIKDNPNLRIARAGFIINHFGFLKTNPEQRKIKNDRYAKKLEEYLEKYPDNARALFSLGIDRNENGREEEGDGMILRSLELDPTFWTARWELSRRLAKKSLQLIMSCSPDNRPKDERWQIAVNYVNDLLKWFPEIQG